MDWGTIRYDLCFGGVFYALIDPSQIGMIIAPEHARSLAMAGVKLRDAIAKSRNISHPTTRELDGLAYVMFHSPQPDGAIRTCTTMRPGRADRSPCGTGSNALMALRHADAPLTVGQRMTTRSIIGGEFITEYLGEDSVGGFAATRNRISGQSWIYGLSQIGLDPTGPVSFRVYPIRYMGKLNRRQPLHQRSRLLYECRQPLTKSIEDEPHPANAHRLLVHRDPDFEIEREFVRQDRDEVAVSPRHSRLAAANADASPHGSQIRRIAVAAISKIFSRNLVGQPPGCAEGGIVPIEADEAMPPQIDNGAGGAMNIEIGSMRIKPNASDADTPRDQSILVWPLHPHRNVAIAPEQIFNVIARLNLDLQPEMRMA